LKIILHVDMNSYFATVEQQSNPFLRGKPICIAGKASNQRTVCAALSMEAKKFGLKSGVSAWEAQNICPQIQIVEADYAKYQFVSQKVFKILESYSPIIEIFSIDEAFLDLTELAKNIDQAKDIAMNIKKRIKDEIGDYLTCSVGISHNKLLAKLASEMQKPDGLTVIDKNNLNNILTKTPIEDVCGIGRAYTRKLQLLGIKYMKDLDTCKLSRLDHFFGTRQAQIFKLIGQGIGDKQVNPYYNMADEKSVGHSYTLPKYLFKEEDAQKVLLKLAEKVGRRLRKLKVSGRTIHTYIRYFDFTGCGEQTTVSRFTNDGLEIYQIALKIWSKWDTKRPIRAVGVSVSQLQKDNQIGSSILTEDIRNENVLKAGDIINDRYGEFTIFRASLTKIKDKVQNIPDGRNKRIYAAS